MELTKAQDRLATLARDYGWSVTVDVLGMKFTRGRVRIRVEWSEHRFTLCPTYRGWQSWHGYGAVELVER